MNRLVKTLLLAVAGIAVLVVVSAVALMLLFDPNDFRERISAEVQASTGRELVIEGDLSVSFFPWLAVEMGRTRLGNAAGFGDAPFASFESARLSVRLLPLLLRREVAVGTAQLESLRLELSVNARGVGNWDDLANGGDAETADEPGSDGGPQGLDIASVEVRNAFIHYTDAQDGSDYTMQNLSLTTGRIALGEDFDFSSTFDFDMKPADLDGELQATGRVSIADDFNTVTIDDLDLNGTVNGIATNAAPFSLEATTLIADIDSSTFQPADVTVNLLGIEAQLSVRNASWADDLAGEATMQVDEFSPRDLAPKFDIELPPTADPEALSRIRLTADAALGNDQLGLRNLKMQMDATALTGEIVLPVSGDAPIRFDLKGDSLNLDRYMAPAAEGEAAAASAEDDDFEIPVEMIRSINARGTLELAEARFTDMVFTNIRFGLTSAAGKLRLNPLAADLYDGSYSGDVQVDASGAVPSLQMNERVADVQLAPLGSAMFGRDQLSGTINGSFLLNARGATLAAMRRNLNGNMAFELADGAWLGVDLWHQLRAARALYRREPPPEPREPKRTDFSSVLASGVVTDGVFVNDNLKAEMPFLQVTGGGTVNLVEGEMDYSLRARVLERPEFLRGATEEELAEFTEALIPVRVRGPITDPSIRPDIEAMFREEVDNALKKKGDELKRRLLDRLAPAVQTDGAAEGDAPPEGEEAAPEEQESAEDQLKKKLKKLFD